VKHCVISYTSTLPLKTKYFREQQDEKIITVLMFYNYKTRAVTIAFIALTYDHPNGFTYLQLGRDFINLFLFKYMAF